MAFYRVELDLCTKQWQEAECVVKATSIEEALEKASNFNFDDIEFTNAYDMEILDYDRVEGIKISNVLGGRDGV